MLFIQSKPSLISRPTSAFRVSPLPRISTHSSVSALNAYWKGPDTGDDNQICLLGGCLLTTYVPLGVVSVRTPLYRAARKHARQRSDETPPMRGGWGGRHEASTYRVVDINTVIGFAPFIQCLVQRLHRLVGQLAVLCSIHACARGG